MKTTLTLLYSIASLTWIVCFMFNEPFREILLHTLFQIANAVAVDTYLGVFVWCVAVLATFILFWFAPFFAFFGFLKMEERRVRAY